MFVPCPHCGFLVALIVSRPDAAQRCPRCGQPLQLADATGVEDASAAPAAAAPAADEAIATGDGPETDTSIAPTLAPDPASPADGDSTGEAETTTGQSAESSLQAGNGADAGTPDPIDTGAAASLPAPTPGAAPATRARGAHRHTRTPRNPSAPSFTRRSISILQRAPRWRGVVAIVVLSLVLALQLLLAQRHALAADARWRPTVAVLCKATGCELRPWREPDAFTMLARDVRPAGTAGVLQVEASFRNDAKWPQAWPRLLLRLNDRHGRTVGERLFTPDEYLGRRMSTPEPIAPGQSASVRFAVREPDDGVVAFDFDFR